MIKKHGPNTQDRIRWPADEPYEQDFAYHFCHCYLHFNLKPSNRFAFYLTANELISYPSFNLYWFDIRVEILVYPFSRIQ